MQLPLTPSNRSKSTGPFVKASVLVALALSAVTAPSSAQALSRRARASASKTKAPTSGAAAKIQALQARRRKAATIYDDAYNAADRRAIFQVMGKIERGDTSRLLIYGQSLGHNSAASNSLGQNSENSFLTIYNPDPACIINGRYEGYCIALSQTDFAPAPASYFAAVATIDKYGAILRSLDSEIEFQNQAVQQAIEKREQAKIAKVQQAQTARQAGMYRARVALADRETAAKLVQLDGVVVGASDKGGAYLQSSAAAAALFNKWGSLGVANRPLLWRAFDDLARASAWRVQRGDWAGATSSAEKLLTLELFAATPGDAQTGKERIELGVDAKDLRMPSHAVGLTMHREGKEPAAAAHLARAWLAELPGYIAGPSNREEKLRVARLSQLLGVEVFAVQPERTQTIAQVVDAVRGSYGPGALAVLGSYVPAVEAAKRERVARQVEAFSQAPKADTPIEAPRVARTLADAPPLVAPVVAPANAPQVPNAPKEVEKPLEKPLVPAVDFVMRSYLNAKKARLSDFRGKTVLLHFWNLPDERQDMSPTPVEKLFALTKRYDPKKVVLVLVSENGSLDSVAKEYRELTDPTPDPERDRNRGHGPRLYPEAAFSLVMGSYEGSPGFYAERAVANQALEFYASDKRGERTHNRVTVISPAGQVVGTLNYRRDSTATEFNYGLPHPTGSAVYDFDEAALEDLLVRAMAAQP